MVKGLDHLARSTRDLLNVLATVSERGAGFRFLNDQWADTTTPHGRLMLTVLGGLAEFDLSLILVADYRSGGLYLRTNYDIEQVSKYFPI
jgi:DNA invertase Pin-like site-specific DNA recombinase